MSLDRGTVDRRRFLKLAGLVPVTGGFAIAAGERADAEPAEAGGDAAQGYRETAHIRTFYRASRF